MLQAIPVLQVAEMDAVQDEREPLILLRSSQSLLIHIHLPEAAGTQGQSFGDTLQQCWRAGIRTERSPFRGIVVLLDPEVIEDGADEGGFARQPHPHYREHCQVLFSEFVDEVLDHLILVDV